MLFADTHVHLYPCYDMNAALGSAFANLGALAAEASRSEKEGAPQLAIFLTERQDCHFFRALKSGTRNSLDASYAIESCSEENVILIRNREGRGLYVFAGRQIVTSERLEVLSLTLDADISDGGNIREVVDRVLAGGGVPVIPWSPGKWFGRRGVVIGKLVNSMSPDRLLIGDSSLRPYGWGEPGLILYAIERGFKIIAGTDPLPFIGEEDCIGRYGIGCSAVLDTAAPLSGMRRHLTDPAVSFSRVGRRNWPSTAFRRLMANRKGRG